LGEVVEFLDARRRPVKEAERKPGPYPYYGANGQQGTIDGYLFDEPLVLLAEDGGLFDQPQRGVAYRVAGKTWVNNHAHALRPKQSVDVAFLCRVLENYDLTPFITGTTRGKLTKAGAEEVLVPVPPLDEQRRIAAILDQADDLRRKRRQTLEQIGRLGTGVFKQMFGDPRRNGLGLKTTLLGNLVENQDAIRVPVKAVDRAETQGEFPYYGASGIIDYVDDYLFDGERLLVGEDGANLLARASPIAFRATGKFWVNNHAHVLADTGAANLTFLEYHFDQIDLAAYVTGTAQPKLTRASLDRIPFLHPSREAQDTFAAHVAEIDKLKFHQRAHLAKLDTLFASLQHHAFRGELWTDAW
jgi:restriction endonuclease S subunit